MEHSLIVKNITKHYPSFTLDKVSFTLPKGSIMGLVGVNGAGKSTTMKSILGLCKPDSGEVTVLGQTSNDKLRKEDIGVVFDECHLHQMLKIKQFQKIFPEIYPNWDASLFEEYMKRFQLPLDKPIKNFSRGMKMKLSIAIAVCHQAKLLILDEPTSGLDPIMRNEILDLFLEYIEDGEKSILVSSHITSDLEKIADYITFINNGKVLMSGNKDDIIYNHGVARGTKSDLTKIPKENVLSIRESQYHCEALVVNPSQVSKMCPNLVIDKVSLEDIMMLLIG